MNAKAQGFSGQIIHFSPADVIEHVRQHPLGAGLHAIHLGWYPRARGHGIERPQGLDECILILCTRGRGWVEIKGRRSLVAAGDALLIPPNTPHAYGADEVEPWSIHWAHFSGTTAVCYPCLLEPDEHVITLSDADARDLVQMFGKCHRLLADGPAERTLLLVSHILRHLLGVLFFHGSRPSRSGTRDAGHDLTRTVQFMRENTTRSLSLQELSLHAALSPSRYSALFREHAGCSPVKHHIRLRMQVACQWFDTTEWTVKEVAGRLGYSDPYYFSRVFRKTLGCSPLAYRRSIKG